MDPKKSVTVLHCARGGTQCGNIALRMMTGSKEYGIQRFVLQCHHTGAQFWLTFVQELTQKMLVYCHKGKTRTVEKLFEVADYHLNSGFAIVAFSPQVVCAV